MILQPLIENAIVHGVAARGSGTVEIQASLDDGMLLVTVRDDGAGLGRSTHRGSGTSLSDLRQRLGLIYGEMAKLSLDGTTDGTCATIRVPARQQDNDEDLNR